MPATHGSFNDLITLGKAGFIWRFRRVGFILSIIDPICYQHAELANIKDEVEHVPAS